MLIFINNTEHGTERDTVPEKVIAKDADDLAVPDIDVALSVSDFLIKSGVRKIRVERIPSCLILFFNVPYHE
jgi:hypothetical protein